MLSSSKIEIWIYICKNEILGGGLFGGGGLFKDSRYVFICSFSVTCDCSNTCQQKGCPCKNACEWCSDACKCKGSKTKQWLNRPIAASASMISYGFNKSPSVFTSMNESVLAHGIDSTRTPSFSP